MSDSELIVQFKQGNVGAFNRLVWRWEKPMFNFIARTIGDQDMARDIFQNTFIKAFKEIKRLREPEKFSPWIYRIALNLCRDEIKRRKRQPVCYLEDLNADAGALDILGPMKDENAADPEKLLNDNEIGSILKRALMSIPEEQRIVIIMKQYQELKFTEIAEILKEPLNTVKSRCYYGLRALRNILEESQLGKEVLLNEM